MMTRWWIGSFSVFLVGAFVAAAVAVGGPARAEASLAGVAMTVHKAPTCDCCGGYIDELRARGVEVTVVDIVDTAAVKAERGVPPSVWSCHTMDVGGYAVEGHVPMEALLRLLDERPEADGIALPGMPAGSPGMSGNQTAPFEVVAFDARGVRAFGEF